MTIPKNKTRLQITLNNKVLAELDRLAEEMEVTRSAVITFLIKTF